MDYWIVVDGSTVLRACGDYRIDIAPCGTLCQTPADCEDNNPCTVDDCDLTGLCQNTPAPTGAPCGDPSDTECDNPDFCNVGGACVDNLEADGTSCEGLLFCTEGETCTAGVCGGGTARDCDDQEPCTDDACDEGGDTCTNTPIPGCCVSDEECDDGVHCNGAEFCNGPPVMQCQPGIPPDCDDGDPCTTDVCDDGQEGCVNTPISGCCLTVDDCDDDNACTDYLCNANLCENQLAPGGTPCGDAGATDCSNPDTCNGTGSCVPNNTNEGGPCDDGDNCTDNDSCVAGVCTGISNGLCEACQQSGPGTDPVDQLSFQALLKDANGDPVPGPVDLTFQFYKAADGTPVGDPIVKIGASGEDGIYSEQIPITQTLFTGEGLELGVSVDATPELTPRIPVTSVPQAFRVSCATGDELTDHLILGGSDTAGELRLFTGGTCGRDARGPGGMEYGSISVAACGGEFALKTIPTGTPTVELNACSGIERGGHMLLSTSAGVETVKLRGGSESDGAQLELRNDSGNNTIVLDGDQSNGGWMYMTDGSNITVSLDAEDGIGGGAVLFLAASTGTATIELDGDESNDGVIRLFDAGQNTSIMLHSDNANSAGQISMFNDNGKETVELIAAEGANNGGQLKLRQANQMTTIILDAEAGGGGAGVILSNSNGENTIVLDADDSDDGVIKVRDAGGKTAIRLHSDNINSAGEISMWNDDGKKTVKIIAAEGANNNGGQIELRKANGTTTITLDAEFGNGGPGRITTEVLEITGGSDLSEQFDIGGSEDIKPGRVVCIDTRQPGRLVVCRDAYDRTVAGIVSGAGGVKPGMLMSQKGSSADGAFPVALMGRVYVWADASNGPIQPGDLVTTADSPGHAMKVTDYPRAHGAIIGKAMTPLREGCGLILVLVSLQ